MNNSAKTGAAKVWPLVVIAGIVICLAGMAYSFLKLQREAGEESQYRQVADGMRLLSRQIAETSRTTVAGDEASFATLATQIEQFDELIWRVDAPELGEAMDQVDASWQPVKASAQALVDAGPRVVYVRGIAGELADKLGPMQTELAKVVKALEGQGTSAATVLAAQKTLWLSERITRNIERIYTGDKNSQQAADEFRTDAAEFIRIVEALTRGDTLVGIDKISSTAAIDSMSSAFRMFSVVATSVDRIADSATELRQAAESRRTIAASGVELSDAVAAMVPAIDKLTLGRLYDRDTLITLFVAPGVLAVGLLLVLFIGQRRRTHYTGQGVATINQALHQISDGDLTVHVTEDNAVTADIARELNKTTERQRELIGNIRDPFEVSIEEINKIGITASGQVEKGRELTRSVVESTTAATEMVRTSEEIKTSTAEAARTSERNSEQVTRGYELTQDMSKASADVRESVQETSKSAKRQGELIQSVTAAAEYIQALNTKISVVAINTRIEAEKAGEYGRPFLGIADSIADLLREAEEEGRKIISQVRMLQNMSAENLSSMENTVGTVVTILQYIERLHSSLEEINSGSAAISEIIRSVDDAAGQSAVSALHMNNSMAEIRECNKEIVHFNESTQAGVNRLQESMHAASRNLGEFRIDADAPTREEVARPDELASIPASRKVLAEEEMSALESTEPTRASV